MAFPFWVKARRSDGQELTFNKNPLGVTALDGMDKPAIEVFTEKNAVGDGDIVTGQRVGARLVTLKAKNTCPMLNDQMRKVIIKFFSPRLTFDLLVCYGSTVRRAAGCRVKALALPIKDIYAGIELTVSLLCPGGYLHGENSFGRNIAEPVGCFGFPFVSLVDAGFPFSIYSDTKSLHINNDGDAPMYCRAVLKARGPVLNPKLTRGAAMVRLLYTMADGDEIVIDTDARTVTLNGASAIRLLDRESSFADMRMEVGDNIIGYDAEDGDNALDVFLYYDKNYASM